MTQEEKQLLIKDLCARLPYGVKVKYIFDDSSHCPFELSTKILQECLDKGFLPYLRPMSSMTEEEKKELLNITIGEDGQKYFTVTSKGIQSIDELIQYGYDWEYHWLDFSNENITIYSDWLNEHYFDYRGLIEKGLALEAPENMYKTK